MKPAMRRLLSRMPDSSGGGYFNKNNQHQCGDHDEEQELLTMTSSKQDISSSSSSDSTNEQHLKHDALHSKNKRALALFLFNNLMRSGVLSMGAMSHETFGGYFAASMMMHCSGIYSLLLNDGSLRTMISAIIGAGLEGVMILSIIVSLFQSTPYRTVSSLALSSSSFSVRTVAYYIMSILLAGSIALFSVAVLASDYVFQKKLGSRPDMWIIVSGFKDSNSLIKAELAASKEEFLKLILGTIVIAALTVGICFLQMRHEKQLQRQILQVQVQVQVQVQQGSEMTSKHEQHRVRRNYLSYPILFFAMVFLYTINAWMPIFHASASLCGSMFMIPPGSDSNYLMKKIDHPVRKGKQWPNVVLVMHESLSGEFILTRESSLKAMPFFTKMLKSDDDDRFYVFEHARTVSGDTTDALTVMQSGCLPLDHAHLGGRDVALRTSMATEFKQRGFDTVSFSSRDLTMKGTQWFMIQNQLSKNFDQVFYPAVTKDPLLNPPAMDDRAMKKHFQKWLEERKRLGNTRPFYAQFYYFNAHYPFLDNTDRSNSTSRDDGMLQTVDESIENIFQLLNDTEQLDNTMVIGSGDHGENYFDNDKSYGRVVNWNKDIFRVPIYIHLPKDLLGIDIAKEKYENLRYNTHQLTSTLDIFPTILHILEGGGSKSKSQIATTDDKCVRGLDLLENRVKESRVAWSFPGTSKDFVKWPGCNMALHKGTSSSLYRRSGQSRNNAYSLVHYDEIVDGYSNHPKSEEERKPLKMNEWKSIVQKLQGEIDGAPLRKKGGFSTEFLKAVQHDVPTLNE